MENALEVLAFYGYVRLGLYKSGFAGHNVRKNWLWTLEAQDVATKTTTEQRKTLTCIVVIV